MDQHKKMTLQYIQVNFLNETKFMFVAISIIFFKDIYSCPKEIIKGLTDKEQFQYLTKLKGPQEGTYLYKTQLISLR